MLVLLLFEQLFLVFDPLGCSILDIGLNVTTKGLSDICDHGLAIKDACNGAILFGSKCIQFVQFGEGFLAWGCGVLGVRIAN